jgi:hypothetical protein
MDIVSHLGTESHKNIAHIDPIDWTRVGKAEVAIQMASESNKTCKISENKEGRPGD